MSNSIREQQLEDAGLRWLMFAEGAERTPKATLRDTFRVKELCLDVSGPEPLRVFDAVFSASEEYEHCVVGEVVGAKIIECIDDRNVVGQRFVLSERGGSGPFEMWISLLVAGGDVAVADVTSSYPGLNTRWTLQIVDDSEAQHLALQRENSAVLRFTCTRCGVEATAPCWCAQTACVSLLSSSAALYEQLRVAEVRSLWTRITLSMFVDLVYVSPSSISVAVGRGIKVGRVKWNSRLLWRLRRLPETAEPRDRVELAQQMPSCYKEENIYVGKTELLPEPAAQISSDSVVSSLEKLQTNSQGTKSTKSGDSFVLTDGNPKREPDDRARCHECGVSFSRERDLRRHYEAVHQNARPHQCDQCPRAFSQRSHLKQHKKAVHTKARDFSCSLCNKSFDTKYHCNRHKAAVHSEVNFECHKCGGKFNKERHLSRHMRETHSETTSLVRSVESMPTSQKVSEGESTMRTSTSDVKSSA